MTILFLTHRLPYPPNKGEKIRAFHLIRELSKHHEIRLVSFVDVREDLEHVEELRRYCASVETVFVPRPVALARAAVALLTGRSLTVGAFDAPALRRLVAAHQSRGGIDAIVAYSSPMAQYVERRPGPPRLADFVDVDSEKWRAYSGTRRGPLRWLYRIEANRLADFETRIVEAFEHTTVVSETEAQLLRARLPGGRVSVIPMGVDLESFRPGAMPPPGEGDERLVFVGAMDYYPNIDAAVHFSREILPLVTAIRPAVRFDIVGRNPAPSVQRLARDPRVRVTGFVPDVRPYLSGARMAVAPFRVSRGVQSKVLEAMAMGLPVVGTGLAFQGLGARESDGVRIADDPRAMADAIVALLDDRDAAARCAAACRAFVERNHRWSDQSEILRRLVERLARGAPGGGEVAGAGRSG